MTATRERAEELVRQALCGEVRDDDPELLAALAGHRDLAEELQQLRAAAAAMNELVGDAASVRAAALAETTPSDRAQVAAALQAMPPSRRRSLAVAAVAAVLLTSLCLWIYWPRSTPTGWLGGNDLVRVERVASGALQVTVLQLPPDGEYRLQLVAEGGTPPPPAVSDRNPWTFPADWMQFLREHRGAQLVVTIRDGSGTRPEVRVSLPQSSR